MKQFEHVHPATLEEAVDLAGRDGASILAGGTNLVDLMKLGVATPSLLVDVRRLLDAEIRLRPDGGLHIGAGARNSEIAAHPIVRERFPAVAQALLAGASGQVRNLATAGGNLLQRTRCSYFQDVAKPCNKRAPGSGCSAQAGEHRNLAILGSSPQCIATHPSDFAVALTAFDAEVRVVGPNGERHLLIDAFYRAPDDRPDRDTVLERGEIVTAVELPPFLGRSVYRKTRDRASFAFALVSAAVALDGNSGDIRIALGGVAPRPWRARRAEEALRGHPPTSERDLKAIDLDLAEARPLPSNAFKVELTRRVVAAMLRELA